MHKAPCFDRIYNSKSVRANIAVVESGPLVSRITAEFSFSVPADYTDGNSRNERLVELPIRIEYTLTKDSSNLLVAMTLDNVAKDHWLRAMFPTELATGVTHADSHFDIVERTIKLPDSTGWVEPAWGAHPLRTFVAMDDGKNCFALFPKGLFEYEAFDDEQRTLGLTLLRCCRIKLALSEEKQMEMPDQGIQCLGIRKFEYTISIQEGSFEDCGLASRAAEYFVPARTVMCGRGKGVLPLENSFLAVNNDAVHITCIKPSDDGKGIVLRCYNTLRKKQEVELTFGFKAQSVFECDMNETEATALRAASCIRLSLAPKQIKTLKIILIGTADDRLTGGSFKRGQSA
jgi:mannosylglycerate hydrolase